MAENYSKRDDKDSVESGGKDMKMDGGGANRDGSGGPTGSSRNYPKGKSIRKTDWNPIKCDASTYGVNGV